MKFAPLLGFLPVVSTQGAERSGKGDPTGCPSGVGVWARAHSGPSPRAGNRRPHAALTALTGSCLPFSNEIPCFYFPCHEDEVSFYFMANILNSNLLRCVSSPWVCVCVHSLGLAVCAGQEPPHQGLSLLFCSDLPFKVSLGLSTVVSLGLDPCKPPSQNRFIFRRNSEVPS